MIIPVPSAQKQFKIRVGIRAFEPCALGVMCYDATKTNSHYIRRRVPFNASLFEGKNKGYKEFTIPFPISPDNLMVELYDKEYGDDNHFKVEKFEIEKTEQKDVWAEPEMHRFIDFAKDFVSKAGYVPCGFYDTPDGEFLIHYMPQILDDLGTKLVTPARTNRVTSRIQVSQYDFLKYTIPIRFMVLLHERYHFQIPTRLEKPADLHALRLYLDLGFPRTEAIYATTKIFLAHPESIGQSHATRVKDAKDFIDDYSLKNKLRFNEA